MLKEKLRAQVLGGCLFDHKDHLDGIYKGYRVTIAVSGTQYVITIGAASLGDTDNRVLGEFLMQQKQTVKTLRDVAVYPYCVTLVVQAPNLARNVPEAINSVTDPVINFLINGQYTSGCQQCGSTSAETECYNVNGSFLYLCQNCASEIEGRLKAQKQEILSKKSNLAAGLVGALLGSLIGCVVWVLIYRLGYIAGIAGAVTGICAMKGYELLGGRLDRKGVIGSVVIMVAAIYFANKVAWSWEAYDALKDYGFTFSSSFRKLGEILKDSELTGSYVRDLIIGYVLTGIASFRNIAGAFMASTGSYSVKKNKQK